MNTTEHLQRIRARCVELLAIAEKRTPGEWKQCDDNHESIIIKGTGEHCYPLRWNNGQGPDDARFIASCAGAAEAGWRSTIAAIDWLFSFKTVMSKDCFDSHPLTVAILAAWPVEMLEADLQL